MQIHPTEPIARPEDPFLQRDLHLYAESDVSLPASELLPQGLIDSFAEATGWELGLVANEIKIIDMSANWPAMTPTAHRGKCDRLAEELSKLLYR